ncbi:MAG: ribose-phosphate pyrophosphokinae [Gammaproteobacteria bacterium]|jgi:ribose-phosphate pyrophosphokinase|nr:ribose-phosphate pyrophosphokinae [Gammaproteobacteria bacterium]
MTPLVFSLYTAESFATNFQTHFDAEWGKILIRQFPDQETYIRLDSNVNQREVIFVASLNQPNEKLLPLLFAANTARQLGASSVGLIAPYLAYMRQDKRFQAGEGITSEYFAGIISQHFDWLSTMDPHLHRHHDMSEIYSIPSQVLHADPFISQWVKQNVTKPLIIGPDEESEQWVSQVAKAADAPYVVLKKIRHSDREVEVSLPEISKYQAHNPVLVDDIISTAKTMAAAVKQLKILTTQPITCIGVHAIFTDNAYQELQQSGAARIITCNTVPHISNTIDVSPAFAANLMDRKL